MRATWKISSAVLLAAMAWACDAAEQGDGQTRPGAIESTAAPAAAAQPSGEDATAICTSVFTRQRECSYAFVPALVDLRIRLDRPAGIAERAAREGRDPLVAAALDEWRADSTDQAIAAACAAIRDTAGLGNDLARAEDCLVEDSCDAFVACLQPVLERFLH